MRTDATNLQNPWMGPGLPLYPEIDQLARVTGPAVFGTNVYPALTSQFGPTALNPFVLRDREPCFVWEPNGVQLGMGYYNCRLVGTFQGVPLYATTCCVKGFPSSMSSSSHSTSLNAFSSVSGALAQCCPTMPATIHMFITNISGCDNINGATVPLIWDGVSTWAGSTIFNGNNITGSLLCIGPTAGASGMQLTATCEGTFITFQDFPNGSASCNPLNLNWLNHTAPGCCGGTVSIHITL